MTFVRIGLEQKEQVKEKFLQVFTDAPWFDDWSDPEQLDMYLNDLMGQSYSVAFGLYEGNDLIGASLGYIKHWYSGTEYIIDELFIVKEKQGKGIGTYFMEEIGDAIREMGVYHIFLLTERGVPAYDFYKKNGFSEIPETTAFWKEV
ncbi:MAG: GNAT family N-acetyltransferase [Oscillospiraceae bacterium]|nr:GNAT family N-acetyltransferase [Oscillospiraceae bacterium]